MLVHEHGWGASRRLAILDSWPETEGGDVVGCLVHSMGPQSRFHYAG